MQNSTPILVLFSVLAIEHSVRISKPPKLNGIWKFWFRKDLPENWICWSNKILFELFDAEFNADFDATFRFCYRTFCQYLLASKVGWDLKIRIRISKRFVPSLEDWFEEHWWPSGNQLEYEAKFRFGFEFQSVLLISSTHFFGFSNSPVDILLLHGFYAIFKIPVAPYC